MLLNTFHLPSIESIDQSVEERLENSQEEIKLYILLLFLLYNYFIVFNNLSVILILVFRISLFCS